jgi:hypothetical protein
MTCIQKAIGSKKTVPKGEGVSKRNTYVLLIFNGRCIFPGKAILVTGHEGP